MFSFAAKLVTGVATYIVGPDDCALYVDCTVGPVTVVLPDAVTRDRQVLWIQREKGLHGTNPMTIESSQGEFPFYNPGTGLVIQAVDGLWHVLNGIAYG